MFNDNDVHVFPNSLYGKWNVTMGKRRFASCISWEWAMKLGLRRALKYGVELVVHNDSVRLRPKRTLGAVDGCGKEGSHVQAS